VQFPEQDATRAAAPSETPEDVVPPPSLDDVVSRGAEDRVVLIASDDGRRQAITRDRRDRRRRPAEDHIAGPGEVGVRAGEWRPDEEVIHSIAPRLTTLRHHPTLP